MFPVNGADATRHNTTSANATITFLNRTPPFPSNGIVHPPTYSFAGHDYE